MTTFSFFVAALVLSTTSIVFIRWGRSLSGTYGAPRWVRYSGWGAAFVWLTSVALMWRAMPAMRVEADATEPNDTRHC